MKNPKSNLPVLVRMFTAVCFIALLPSSHAQQPAATTTKASAYGLLKKHMQQFAGSGFSQKSSLGSMTIYRKALSSVTITIDPKLKAVAQYDPKTETIVLSKDPRGLSNSDANAMGETIWHELTHRIEHTHNDFGILDDESYAERNVEYIEYVTNNALPVLKQLERQAAAGAPKSKLKTLWKVFARRMNEAWRLHSTEAYPPDIAELKSWTGFDVSLSKIKRHYASGAAGTALKSLFETIPVSSLSGTWSSDWGALTLSQNGTTVTGSYTHDSGRITGALVGNILSGTWSEAPTYAGDNDSGQFIWTLSSDFRSFSGTWGYGSSSTGGSWTGTKQ